MLCALFSGCAGQNGGRQHNPSLLAFSELADEISVSHVDLSVAPLQESGRTTAADIAP